MNYGIVSVKTGKAQRDKDGNILYFETKRYAEEICLQMNYRAKRNNGVDPLRDADVPDLFKVVPW